jgi:hypothetical protein
MKTLFFLFIRLFKSKPKRTLEQEAEEEYLNKIREERKWK